MDVRILCALGVLGLGCGDDASSPSVDAASAIDAGPCALSDACVQQELGALCEQAHVLGAVMVLRTPEGRFRATCGFADVAQTRPVVLNDRFRVGSFTKTFTSALALQLVDEDVLSLDTTPASVGVTIDNADVITLRH